MYNIMDICYMPTKKSAKMDAHASYYIFRYLHKSCDCSA